MYPKTPLLQKMAISILCLLMMVGVFEVLRAQNSAAEIPLPLPSPWSTTVQIKTQEATPIDTATETPSPEVTLTETDFPTTIPTTVISNTPSASPTPITCDFGAPQLFLPENMAQFDYTIAKNPIRFSWQDVCGAVEYKIKLKNRNTDKVIFAQTLSRSEAGCDINGCHFTRLQPLTPSHNTKYEWSVIAKDAEDESEPSDPFQFTLLTELGTFELQTPCDQGSTFASQPVFSWQAATNTQNYELTLSSGGKPQFSKIYLATSICSKSTCSITFNTEQTSFTPKSGKTYKWRVKATNGVGKPSKSEKWKLTGNDPLKTILLELPANKSPVASSQPWLSWQADTRITEYRVKVRINGKQHEQSDWAGCKYDGAPVSSNPSMTCPAVQCEYQIQKSLLSGATYNWQVTGRTANGEKIKSHSWYFNTK